MSKVKEYYRKEIEYIDNFDESMLDEFRLDPGKSAVEKIRDYFVDQEEENKDLLNDPEFSDIIDEAEREISENEKFKPVRDKDLEIYWDMKTGKRYYEVDSVMKLVEKYDKLVKKLNERNNNG